MTGPMNSPKIVTNFPTSPNLQYWTIIIEYSSSLYYSTLCFALKISAFCTGGVARAPSRIEHTVTPYIAQGCDGGGGGRRGRRGRRGGGEEGGRRGRRGGVGGGGGGGGN